MKTKPTCTPQFDGRTNPVDLTKMTQGQSQSRGSNQDPDTRIEDLRRPANRLQLHRTHAARLPAQISNKYNHTLEQASKQTVTLPRMVPPGSQPASQPASSDMLPSTPIGSDATAASKPALHIIGTASAPDRDSCCVRVRIQTRNAS